MIFEWFRRRRRRQLIAQPFPDAWESILVANVYHYRGLSEVQQRRVRDDVRVLVAEKNWEGCGGLAITDEIKVTIAAQMAILVLGQEPQYFDSVLSILVYPDAYLAPERQVMAGGVIAEGNSARDGEAWYRGPVILSWADALAGGRGGARGRNLVFHEFAHQLDMMNGRAADGMPAMNSDAQAQRWHTLIHQAYEQLCRDCQRRVPTVFDCYGATNLAEFFAVATEAFFESPRDFERDHAPLYSLFQQYYRQDPLARTSRTGTQLGTHGETSA